MGIKGSVLHDNVLGNADTERGEVPYGLDTTLYHGIRYLLAISIGTVSTPILTSYSCIFCLNSSE